MPNIDLSKLEGTIKERKEQMMEQSSTLGEKRIAPKDGNFLNEIQTALHTRSNTPTTDRMNAINKVSEAKIKAKNSGGNTRDVGAEQILSEAPSQRPQQQRPQYQQQPQTQQPQTQQPQATSGSDRDQTLYSEMQKMQSMYQQNYGFDMNQNQPQNMSEGYQQPTGGMLNEHQVNEIVNKQLPMMVVETMKNVILEQYANEKFVATLLENKDVIEKIMREHLRALQERKKSKTT